MKRTTAFSKLKAQTQQMLDFAVLTTVAAPNLAALFHRQVFEPEIQIVDSSIFSPSRDPFSTAKRALTKYEGVMGATLFTSAFAYFKAYFFSAIEEIIEFHGGKDELKSLIKGRLNSGPLRSGNAGSNLDRLRARYNPSRNEKYRNASRSLRSEDPIWPSSRFMLFGFTELVRQSDRWKAHEILKFAVDLLNVDLSDEEKKTFNQLRNDRNEIAHGRVLDFELQGAVNASQFFRSLAEKIDQVIVRDFMIIERFAR